MGTLNWDTIGAPVWFGQTSISHDGVDAAQSGAVVHNSAATMQTTVEGPGALSFWWKVSSEENKDYLKFFINGVQQSRISGEVDWQSQRLVVPAGPQVCKWTYSKNPTDSRGLDRGWVDQVQFVPGAGECVITLSTISASHSAGFESGQINVTTDPGCRWEVINTNAWIGVTASSSEGNGFVRYTLPANNSSLARTGLVTIAGQTFTLVQLGGPCAYSIAPPYRTHSNGGATGTIAVASPAGCAWNVSNTNAWITITSSLSNSGNGQVTYSVSTNPSFFGRSGQIQIDAQTFTVTQSGVPNSLAEALDTIGTPLVWITAGNAPWFAQSEVTHDGVDAARSGSVSVGAGNLQTTVTGPGTLTFWWKISSPETNSDLRFFVGSSQTARIEGELDWQQRTVMIPPGTFSLLWIYSRTTAFSSAQNGGWVDQVQFVPTAVCPVTLSSNSASPSSGSSTGLIEVAAGSACTWSVSNTNSWISIVSGSSGTGSDTVIYSVAANPSSSVRSGILQIANQFFLVTQAGGGCAYSISPTTRHHGSGMASNSVTVTAGPGCPWLVLNTNSWITFVSGNTGAGNASVFYAITANNSPNTRTGNIQIAGQAFAITQSGNDTPPSSNSIIALPEALDTLDASLAWLSSGAVAWTGQDIVTHDGVDAAQSGSIPDAASSTLQTTISGPGSLSFWWKVSSEADHDDLRFYIDGVEQMRISGETGWQQRTASIASGAHVLKWTYSKDAALSAGQDRAWLDQVQFGNTASCTFSLSATSALHMASSTTGLVAVTTTAGCDWTTIETNSWVNLTAGLNGSDSAFVRYTLTVNTSTVARTAVLLIAGQPFTIRQLGMAPASMLRLDAFTPGMGATLSIQGTEGRLYVIESSEDLVHWRPIGTNSTPGSITENATTNAPRRFYRSYELP